MPPEPVHKGSPYPRAKKRLGQHFLIDKNIIEKIVAAGSVSEGDYVIEIGPGTGALTERLLRAGARVLAIELDAGLAAFLEEKFPGLEVVNRDALKISYAALSKERAAKFKVVSNLPYNISGPILAKFLLEREAFTGLVLMFQKEVAERLVAGPGTKAYGALSVFTQTFTDVKREFNVSRNLFTPRPKVDSSVVSMRILSEPKVEIRDEAFFRTVVKAAFGSRRKTLSNALKSLGLERDAISRALQEAGINPQRRGETLDPKEFGLLADALSKVMAEG